jgi:hypothetical protein
MVTSIFMNLAELPGTSDKEIPLGETDPFWMESREFVFCKYPAAIEEWHVSGNKYGWVGCFFEF